MAFNLIVNASTVKNNSLISDELKPRIVVLTDIAPGDTEPDDMESMVRLLSHADLFEIEAIITCSGWNNSGGAYTDQWANYLLTVIDSYEEDLPNLMKRSEQNGHQTVEQESTFQKIGYWPSAEYIRSRHLMGSRFLGVDKIGKENGSPGCDEIIRLAEEDDERPLWILVWGGANTVAQALWQLIEYGDLNRLNNFLSKIKLYTITDQDVDWGNRGQYDLSSHKWMRNIFGNKLFFIWDESAWTSHCEIGVAHWRDYEENIQGKGKMGGVYPRFKYGVEGDTPSFLYVLPNGLNDPNYPSQGSWGGYFRKVLSPDGVTTCYSNMRDDIKSVSRKYEEYFYPAIFNNFAARMGWAAEGKGNRNPEIVINGNRSFAPIHVNGSQGEKIVLDISGSYDPDGDEINFKWWIMNESKSCSLCDFIDVDDAGKVIVTIPFNHENEDIHLICECTDTANIPLTSYRRIIINCIK
jgi:hypothetical protein